MHIHNHTPANSIHAICNTFSYGQNQVHKLHRKVLSSSLAQIINEQCHVLIFQLFSTTFYSEVCNCKCSALRNRFLLGKTDDTHCLWQQRTNAQRHHQYKRMQI